MMLCAFDIMCIARHKYFQGVFEPVEPPGEKSQEAPTFPRRKEFTNEIKIENDIMAVVGANSWDTSTWKRKV